MSELRILLTGASGQIGQVLYENLVNLHGQESVIASDVRQLDLFQKFEYCDITDSNKLREILQKHRINQIYHLAAILSAKGELNPIKAWDVNMNGLLNVLEAGARFDIQKIFFPSSIAAFGTHVDLEFTPQHAPRIPTTVYGLTKVAGENWTHFYNHKKGLDVRSLRYPGIVGYRTMPGGGTTDYAVHIYHAALKDKSYCCYLKPDTKLPMIYMDDAIKATLMLMDAPAEELTIHSSYNLQGMSFTPAECADSIRKFIPDFKITYEPDFRQEIADSWPRAFDDSDARRDWNWKPDYDLDRMTEIMLTKLSTRLTTQL
jgi:nucleoside-diphosphate-sugar epimerase